MGRQKVDQSQLFYLFSLEERIPARHLLRGINPTVTRILGGLRENLEAWTAKANRRVRFGYGLSRRSSLD